MRTMPLLGLAGLTAAAGAQTDVTASDLVVALTWSSNDVSVGDSVTGTLTVSWSGPGTTYLSSVNIDLIANRDDAYASNAVVAWNNPVLGYDGVGQASGADILGIDAAQTSLFAPPQTGNPFVIATFQVVATDAIVLSYTARNSTLGTIAAFTISDTALPTANPAQFGADVMAPNSLSAPAPAGLALVGSAGIIAARRRR